ncbi:hypothetical protein [Sutcliffiella horikoshii]|uniref:hypothetical protein n=1 Tax=Sutcliffiella horikoshii TaxID=79883 RepID=UPI001CFD4825|nr:hypothetical protein [Sutcliffiella horikoshii]
MKRFLFAFFVGFAIFFGSLSNISAAQKEGIDWKGKVVEELYINETLTVEKLKDGRVKPVDGAIVKNLKEEELNTILNFMGHDILTLVYGTKVDIVTSGGKAPESTSYKLRIKDYDENYELESEQVIDLNTDGNLANDSISILSIPSAINECRILTGCFKGNLAISYIGKIDNKYQYRFYYNFDFPDGSNGYDDYVGLAWRGTGTKKAGSDLAKQYTYSSVSGSWHSKDLSLSKYSVYGNVYKVPSSTAKYYGFYRTDVYYASSSYGNPEILAGNYGANWQSVFNSISIGAASIDITKTDREYILEKNFTVGK